MALGNAFTVPVALTETSLSYDSSNGTNTTVMGIFKDGIQVGPNLNLAGPRGTITGLILSFALGERISIGHVAGPLPQNMVANLYMV